MSCFNNKGNAIKKIKDGSASQKTLVANADTFAVSLVSMYNQNIASTDMSGMDVNIAPMKVLRLAFSVISMLRLSNHCCPVYFCIQNNIG